MAELFDSVEIDPILLQEDLQERMLRYLLTSLPIHRRFQSLREEAYRELSETAALIRGPFLETLPDFRKGRALCDLVEEGVLHPGFAKLDTDVFNRPLHLHQEEAIRRIVTEQQNVIVSTGTGSGKTECFFFPLLNYLLNADLAGKPGVRVILVYPLNALANDQLYQRLVPVLAGQLKQYGLTVGRYTGQTTIGKNRKWFENEYLSDHRFKELFGNKIPENWLLSREEMLERPPHVLVTNYAMLEHLLLLPRNAALFHKADLRFLVLDEVHTYAGAQATEVSLLLRKLRDRYAGTAEIRCIGTSATLGGSSGGREKVLSFARRLFGFPFAEVVSGEREAHRLIRNSEEKICFSSRVWIELHRVLREVRELPENNRISKWNERMKAAKLPLMVNEENGKTLAQLLCAPLSQEENLRNLSEKLSKTKLLSFCSAAEHLFKDAANEQEAQNALKGLVSLGAFARETLNTFPLLPARYHFFARGIEEATIQLSNGNSENAVNLRFRREFEDHQTGAYRYRLMTCRKCGELYFEAFEKGQQLSPESRGRGWTRSVFWLKRKDTFVIPEDSTDDDAVTRDIPNLVFVHLQNGKVRDFLDETDDPSEWLGTHRARMDSPDRAEIESNPDARVRVTICQSCGAHDRNEIITPFHPGDQALSTAISEVLFSHLPTSKDEVKRTSLPGRGRNMLVFSDNRQDAAFFAPYLQRLHEDLLIRRAIVQMFRASGGIHPLRRISDDLEGYAILKRGLTNRDGGRAVRSDRGDLIRGKVFSEFCSPGGSRSSLEDLGIIEIVYNEIDLEEIAAKAGVSNRYGGKLVRWILDTIRRNRAISMPSGIRALDDFVWGAYAQDDRRYSLEIRDPRARFHLLPSRRESGGVHINRYVDVFRDKLEFDDWEEILGGIWEALTHDLDGEGEVLVSDGEGEHLRALDYRLISAKLREEDQVVYRCEKCSRISLYDLGGVCTQWRCYGTTEPVNLEDWRREMGRNHYHFLYSELKDLPSLIVKEHTAAISSAVREEIEKDFKEGEINVLSSSTTMEMGIDLGDLEGVLLRNVPPGISNYEQRAGRAGRRAQAAPVSITYARNRRYDQDVFENAENFLGKEPSVPFVHLSNPRLFQRHQFSILISTFLESELLTEGGLQIGQLFGLPKFDINRQSGGLSPQGGGTVRFSEENENAFYKKIVQWMASENAGKAKALAGELLLSLKDDLVEQEFQILRRTSDILDQAFLDAVRRLASTFGQRFRHYQNRSEELSRAGDLKFADRQQNRAYRWANQPIVNFLSKYGLIPTYTFPVDNIELEVIQGGWSNRREVELSRDARLGVVEYAPGAEVVAGGRVWTSRAIPYAPREFMPPFYYKICGNCRNIESFEDSSLIPRHCTSCGSEMKGTVGNYIEPTGFTTAVGEANGKEPGASRELPPRPLETQLIGNAPERLFVGTDLIKVDWAAQHAQHGRMVVINRGHGEGFVKCQCGYAHAVTKSKRFVESHKNPFTDQECKVAPSSWKFDLAHTFHTDVLQIRILLEVPLPDPLPGQVFMSGDEEVAREGVARSIAEAIRMAACEMVPVPDREMSSTFRWLAGGGLELILFDNVPGGAGYTARVIECQASDLVHYAIYEVLNCPDGCSTSCSKCLRSFSNQAYWDEFRRNEASRWLERVLNLKREDSEQIGGEKISPAGLEDLCSDADHIAILRKSLGNFAGAVESDESGNEIPVGQYFPEWERLNRWMVNGKKVTGICQQVPQFNDRSLPRARRLAESFLPLVRQGALEIRQTSPGADDLISLPQLVLCRSSESEATVIYDMGGKGDVLDQLWSNDDALFAKRIPRDEAERILSKGCPVREENLELSTDIERFHYKSNEPRNFARDFAFLSRGPVRTLELTDRYMVAADWSADFLREFLIKLGNLMTVPPKNVCLRYGPEKTHEDRFHWKRRIERVTSALAECRAFEGTEIYSFARSNSRFGNNFHDRRLLAHFEANGVSRASGTGKRRQRKTGHQETGRKILAELTGGVSVLMEPKYETTVYVFED